MTTNGISKWKGSKMGETQTMWSIMDASTKGKVTEVNGLISRRYFHANGGHGMLLVGTEVFDSEQGAIAAAKVKVAKRIASLEKTLAKVRKNPFAPATEVL